MHIRCEKCNTLYELDEKLLPPQGAPVQCSKCQFVFRAYPSTGPEPDPASTLDAAQEGMAQPEAPGPAAAAEVEEGAGPDAAGPEISDAAPAAVPGPAAGEAASAGRRVMTSSPAPEVSGARGQAHPGKKVDQPSGPATIPDEPQFTADGRPIRKVPFPTEEPAAVGPRPVLGPVGRASPVTRIQRRWALVVIPLVVLLLLAVAFVAWRMLGGRADPATEQRRAEGHSMLLPHGHIAPAWARAASPGPCCWRSSRTDMG